jgi:putative chitinase
VPSIGLLTACYFWKDAGLNELADADEAGKITRAINGGTNGLQDRLLHLQTMKALV